MAEAHDVNRFISNRFGLEISVSKQEAPEGQLFIIKPHNIPHTVSFEFRVTIGWRSVESRFIPGPFASDLIKAMQNTGIEQKPILKVFINSAIDKGADIHFKINETTVDPLAVESWPEEWKYIEFEFRKGSLALDNNEGNAALP